MKFLRKLSRKLPGNRHVGSLNDSEVRQITKTLVALADTGQNLEALSQLTSGLHMLLIGDDAYTSVQTIMYFLSEYIDLLIMRAEGKPVNEEYLNKLHGDLLKGRIQ